MGCDFVFYLDPKLAVGTIISDESSRILLIRRAIEPGHGKWVFPGGFVERGEEVRDAARREALEESGLEVHLNYLVGVYSYTGRVPVVLVFAAKILTGTLDWRDEGLEGRFFQSNSIPWNDLAFQSTADALRDYFSH
jgi:ADP-ribose pyrophosphatase YjhB (NUDIX family)